MAVRIRRNVYSLPPGDQTVDWYRRAVARLLQKPASDPTSWVYMAAVHGTPNAVPPPAQGYWDQCQHQSWYFLPWHRGYITAFEAVIARTVQELGGPADWALPYWDYTQSLQQNPRARLMPASFFNARLPNGSPNALWSRRRAVTGGNFGLTDAMVSRGALNVADFSRAQPGAPTGFGGPITGFHPGGGTSGAVESVPHNIVHVQIGGLMRDPNTAALDPIFWLHHCNIDRLWEMWRTNHRDSADPRWLTGVSFRMHNGAGQPFTYTSRDMLDTTRVLHGYRYDDVPPVIRVGGITESVEGGLESVAAENGDHHQPELAGANEGPIDITSGNRTVVSLAAASMLESTAAISAPSRVYLNLENVTGHGENGNFHVYVDMPDDEREPTFVGILSTFGVERASKSDNPHGGSGISQVFDISEIAGELGINSGTADKLRVTFEPVAPPEQGILESAGAGDTDDGEGELPDAVLEFLGPQLESAAGQRVQVGRVSLFVE